MTDFLDQLAEMEVGEPPPEFDRRFHERLNRSLTVQHVVDLLTGAVPWAVLLFLRAALGVAAFSLTGKFEQDRRKPQ